MNKLKDRLNQRQLDTFRWSRGEPIEFSRVHAAEHKYMQGDLTVKYVPSLYFREILQWNLAESILSEYEMYQQGRMEGFKAGITIAG